MEKYRRTHQRRTHVYGYVRERMGADPTVLPEILEDKTAELVQAEMDSGTLRDHNGKSIKSLTSLMKWREHVSASKKAAKG